MLPQPNNFLAGEEEEEEGSSEDEASEVEDEYDLRLHIPVSKTTQLNRTYLNLIRA